MCAVLDISILVPSGGSLVAGETSVMATERKACLEAASPACLYMRGSYHSELPLRKELLGFLFVFYSLLQQSSEAFFNRCYLLTSKCKNLKVKKWR